LLDAHTTAAELLDDAVARNGLTDHVFDVLTAEIRWDYSQQRGDDKDIYIRFNYYTANPVRE
jgi:hypothetical protein